MTSTSRLPNVSAVYFVLDGNGRVLYVGASKMLGRRWNDHHRRKDLEHYGAAIVEWYEVEPRSLADEEQRAIEASAPLLNHKNRYFLRTARPRNGKVSHIYFPVRVLNGMRKLAEKNRRSVSAEMIIAAERYIAESKSDNGRPAAGKGKR